METESKFKSWIKILVALFILLTGLLITSFVFFLSNENFPSVGILAFLALLLFMWAWILFGEIRTKAVKVTIERNHITVYQYLGLGKKKIYPLEAFDGFKTSLLPSEYNTYEFLYLVTGDRKTVKLSEFYHQNYKELKNTLATKVKNLGNENFNLLREIKEIFI